MLKHKRAACSIVLLGTRFLHCSGTRFVAVCQQEGCRPLPLDSSLSASVKSKPSRRRNTGRSTRTSLSLLFLTRASLGSVVRRSRFRTAMSPKRSLMLCIRGNGVYVLLRRRNAAAARLRRSRPASFSRTPRANCASASSAR